MKYEYIKTQENGDATCNYTIKADYPILFEEFFKNIINNTNDFRVKFCSQNESYGGWWQNSIELNKHDDGKWYYEESKDELWQKYKQEKVAKCWCNGGWGQTTYFLSFAEPTINKSLGE